jgi:succinate dehydrogenase/fumarate reductase flavoprotein subunit
MALPLDCDVLVAGSGNAGFSAAISAVQSGAKKVIIIEKSPEQWVGGNSFFTAGAFRTVHGGLDDLLPLVNNVDNDTAQKIDMEPYAPKDFSDDIYRVTAGRTDPGLSKILVQDSNATIKWLASNGVRFQLSFNRQAYEVNGRLKFWGGMSLKTEDGGKGLIEDHLAAASRHGITVIYSTALKRLVTDPDTGAVTAAVVESSGRTAVVNTKAIVLAAGGFEANPRMRAAYLGPSFRARYSLQHGRLFGDCDA